MSKRDKTPGDPKRCPVCGAPNLCAIAAGLIDEPCWCSQIEVTARVLDNVPPHERRERCLCPACAVDRRQ